MGLVELVARDSVATLRGSGTVYLNWLYLVENVVIVILIIFYFFYFNRIVGFALAATLRRLYWKRNNSYFEIGGISFSFLGGEIIFNDLRYISRNQSIRIARGHITWKYWLRKVRSEEDRPSVSMHGAEWFLYNRTPAYDAILEQLGLVDPESPWPNSDLRARGEELGSSDRTTSSQSPDRSTTKDQTPFEEGENDSRDVNSAQPPIVESRKKASTDWWREALPIDIKCKSGAIIMGNPSTPTILIAGFDSVRGTYSASKVATAHFASSRSSLDEYKEVYRMKFLDARFVYRTNPDFQGSMTENGQHTMEELRTSPNFSLLEFLRRPRRFGDLPSFSSLLETIPGRQKKGHGNVKAAANGLDTNWTGLPRYQAPADGVQAALQLNEYAKVTTLLITPELDLGYYCDVAGLVPVNSTSSSASESVDIGNGDLSPEWGVDLTITGGVLLYGPWADKQRAFLQQAFTPATYFNAIQTPRLKPGDQRIHTCLKFFIEFSEETIFRIPTREPSKDWQYDSIPSAGADHAVVRPYGWLDATVGAHSTISYNLPFVSTSEGYETLIEVHLDKLGISSSVNYATFIHAETCRLHWSLPSPLGWDASRTWKISTFMSKFDAFLLRDHITLLTDVAKDWTSGPPGDYEHFVPFMYQLDVKATDYKLRLYVNDHDIINNPSEVEDNTFLIAQGPILESSVAVPSDKYRMAVSEVQFKLAAYNLNLNMSLPEWNTHASFLTDRSATFATTPELTLNGKYRFYAQAHPNNVERLELNVSCRDVIFKALGWMVRHMFNFRDNYFGTFTHFVTLEEYRHRHERNIQGDPLELKWRPEKASGRSKALAHREVDLRNHDYFMELAVNVEPIRIMDVPDVTLFLTQDFSSLLDRPDSIRIQSLEVTANRLFGPQPRTATYMCIWSFYLGSFVGSVPPSLLQSLARAGSSVAYNFDDKDNSLPPDYEVVLDPDATFLTVDIASIDLAVKGQSTALQVDISEPVSIKFDDLAKDVFLKHVAVEVPALVVRALAPLFGKAAPWMEVASFEADFSLAVGLSSSDWIQRAKTQRDFIQTQDALTQRCPFIYSQGQAKSQSIGDLFLPPLESPTSSRRVGTKVFTSPNGSLRLDSDEEIGDSDDEPESETETIDSSDYSGGKRKPNGSSGSSYADQTTSTDDDIDPLRRLPSWTQHGDRFSSYGAVLRLCERAHEAALLDRPTFRRLPPPSHYHDSFAEEAHHREQKLPSMHERLKNFGSPLFSRTVSRTVVDLTSRRPIRVVLTPVSAQVGADILDRLHEERDYERCLDDIYESFVSSQGKIPGLRYSDLEVKASLPAIHIDSIQDVLRPEDAISIRDRDQYSQGDSTSSTVLCTVRLTIDDIEFTCHQTEDGFGGLDDPTSPMPPLVLERKFSGQAAQTRLQVFHPPPTFGRNRPVHELPKIGSDQRTRPTALDLVIGRCSANVAFNAARAMVGLDGGEARLDFVDEAAELIIGTVWAWRVVHDVFGPLAERRARKQLHERRLIWSIAMASQQAAISSFPSFLVRASYLYSRKNLRSDDNWKVLHQLRHCLRLAHQRVRHNMDNTSPWPTIDGLYLDVINIFERWQTWGIDTDDLARSQFVAALFGMQTIRSNTAQASSVPSANVSINKPLAFEWRAARAMSHFWIGSQCNNQLSIGPFETFISSSGRRSASEQIQMKGRSTLHEVEASLSRDLDVLIRHVARVRSTFERKIQLFSQSLAKKQLALQESISSTPAVLPSSAFMAALPAIELDASVGIRRFSASALAEDLEAKAIISHFFLSTTSTIESTGGTNALTAVQQVASTTGLSLGHMDLTAHEVSQDSNHLLLSSGLDQLNLVASARADYTASKSTKVTNPTLQVMLATKAMHLRVPRDAVRAFEFVDKWRTSALPEYDSLLTDLRAGLEDAKIHSTTADTGKSAVTPASAAPVDSVGLVDILQRTAMRGEVIIPLIALEAQAIPTLKVGYSVQQSSLFARRDPVSDTSGPCPVELGLHVGAQSVRFVPVSAQGNRHPSLPAETAFHLPVVRVAASLDDGPRRHVKILTTIDSVSIKLTMGIVDSFLTVQEHFGKELEELLQVVSDKRAQANTKGLATPAPASQSTLGASRFTWETRFALRGLRLGVKGPQATQWFEAELLEAQASSKVEGASQRLHWRTSVQNLGLSLTQNVVNQVHSNFTSESSNRLAFFRVDLSASNAVIHLPDLPAVSMHAEDKTPHLHLRVTRLHAVLQPTAIEALGDLVEFYVHEAQLRRATRREAVTAIQERVVQTFDEFGNDEDDNKAMSWLATCIISLEMQNIGIAIPLNDETISLSDISRSKRQHDKKTRPAFLTTLPSLKFAAQKGSAGYAQADGFAFQFVRGFNQERSQDFDGSNHDTMNRIVLPQMRSRLRAPTRGPMLVHSQVSGLEVDLEPSIVAFSLSLIDVYRLSHERFAKFATGSDVPPTPQPTPAPSRSASTPLDVASKSAQATFEFASGTIRFHSPASISASLKKSRPSSPTSKRPHHRRGRSLHEDLMRTLASPTPSGSSSKAISPETEPDIVRLPELTVWAEYVEPEEGRDVQVHVDAKIHASNNTLNPSLLPFIADVASQLKRRALEPGPTTRPPSPTLAPISEASLAPKITVHGHSVPSDPPPALRRVRISVSLKVDQSRLEISCLPAAEVTARLTWESGGFLLVLSPDVKGVDFSLRVDGVAAGLRHSFSPEDCLLAEAKGLTSSITFQAARDPFASTQGQLSVVIDVPDLAAEMNFRHLQDWLCLKAVWLDRMDLALDVKKEPTQCTKETEPASTKTAPSNVLTIVQARVAKFRFLCDLGQAIGRFNFITETISGRLRWVPGESREFTAGVEHVKLSGQGRAGGSLSIDGVLFSTRLRDSPEEDHVSGSDLLQIQIGIGKIVASLEYEFHKLLVVDADPIAVLVSDDWSSATGTGAQLLLAFDIKMGSFNLISTTSTIPTLIGLSKRVQALIEEKQTLADQNMASVGLPPRPATAKKNQDVVAAVASKLAHDDFKSSTCGGIRILNRLNIELARIRLAVFPEHFNDSEVFRLDAGAGIKARLERGVDQDHVINRDLHLFLGFFSIRRVNHRKVSPSQESSFTTGEWYELFRTSTERNIFKIGTTVVAMESTQVVGSKRLRHKFTMDFRGQVDLALNYALLRNLGTLAQRYQRHMDRVALSKTTSLYAEPASQPINPPVDREQSSTTGSTTAFEDSEVASRTITEDELPASQQSVVSMRPTPLVQAATGDSGPLEFEAIEMHVHQPKLTLLGDATPPLEWIGLQRDRFPAWIHTGVSSPLEELLIALSSTYQTQLARQKLAGKRPLSQQQQ
ncbi:Macrophage colony-stimulating factor 1 receptor [Microbotryomycetes sp. JL221]|nr:Macrophage colony-stimulating factor 1 receptor [Microbotryomycetes sp. JL221]